jgi:hypothetical protein
MTALPSWPRSLWTEGGSDPLLFFGVFGRFDEATLPAMSEQEYRSRGVLPPVQLRKIPPETAAGLREITWESFAKSSPELASQVEAAPDCLLLQGNVPDPANLDYLRDAIGMLQFLLDHGGVALFDALCLRWWTPGDWREEVFTGGEGSAARQVGILISDEPAPGRAWIHTRGMLKFGRPDLSVHDVTKKKQEAIIAMIQRFIEMMIQGSLVPEGQAIKMPGLTGLRCHHEGDFDDPDFNNAHIEIR